MSEPQPTVAVLATLDTKAAEALFVAGCLARAGVRPWVIDLSLKPHQSAGADVPGAVLARADGVEWAQLAGMDRREAATRMIAGGGRILRDAFAAGALDAAVGLGGANGTHLACAIMRALPYLVPKAMVSAVAASGAVQWYVAEADIAMYPSIGDVSLNRITRAVMENAAVAVAAAATNRAGKVASTQAGAPLVAVSSFGGTAGCVDRVAKRLEEHGYEVILFHASGIGGRALERLAREGELAGVIDITTHELTDLVVGGVYSAGDGRLTGPGAMGLPQVVVPGATDHANFWVGGVPERYRAREFFEYNAQNLLMRTNAAEFEALGRVFAERLNAAKGPVRVLIPVGGFSEHTKRRTYDLAGNELGFWAQPDTDRAFVESLRAQLRIGRIDEVPRHINDPDFADACVEAFLAISGTQAVRSTRCGAQ